MSINPTYLKWGGGILLALILFIILRKKGVFRNVIPTGVKDSPQLSDAENATARRLAVTLYEDMDGLTWNRNMRAWREFMGLRDAVARQVYTVFGQLYYDDEKQTLTDWVADEANWQDPQNIASREQVLARLAAMGLTPSAALVRKAQNTPSKQPLL